MDRSSLPKFGIVAALVALYLGMRIMQERAANPPQPAATPTPAANSETPKTVASPPSKMPKFKQPVKELQKIEIKAGSGKEAKTGQPVTVHYRGMLTNGTIFDESYKRGEPFNFSLGAGEVIKGWDEGVVGMKEGGKRWLIIPSYLAYGPEGRPPTIPQNATLVFEVELLKAG